MFLESILDTAEEASKEIVVENEKLSEILEDLLHLNRGAVHEMQQLLGRPSDLYIKKILENTTRYYRTDGDKVMSMLYSYRHI